MSTNAKFHLSLPCHDIEKTKQFYIDELGFDLGRNSHTWFDVDIYGNQITFTEAGAFNFNNPDYIFDKQILPSFHFGVILLTDEWEDLHNRLNAWNIDTTTKTVFLEDQPGEHSSFFIKDPNGFLIEFKTFIDSSSVFAELDI